MNLYSPPMRIPFPSCPGRIGHISISPDRRGSPMWPKIAGYNEQDRTSSLAIRLYCLFFLLLVISCSGKNSGSTAPIGTVSQATEQSKPPTTSPTSESAATVPTLVDTKTNGTNLTSSSSATDGTVGSGTMTSTLTSSITSTTTTATQQLSDLNQLNFSPIPTIGGNQYCATSQYVSANQCKTRDFVDIAAGNASVTCALRGAGSTMHCVSSFTYAIFSDPWQKAPYVPGTLNAGAQHVCAMSASDNTYYCWGNWGYETDTTGFWDTFSCSSVAFKVEDDYSVKNTNGVTTTTLCKASRKQKGFRFLSTGNTNCEVVNGAPICAMSQLSLSSADTNYFQRLSAFATKLINPNTKEELSISHTCTVHQDASVTCNHNGTTYAPKLDTTATIKTNTIAVGPYFGCAYITSSNVKKIGCWSMGITGSVNEIIILMRNSDNQFSSIKSNGSMFCAATPQNQVSCWLPPNPNPLEIPLPPTVSSYTVGNGYVCTLDATGTAGCWDEFGTSITSLQL